MDLFFEVNTRAGKAIHAKNVKFSWDIYIYMGFFFLWNNLSETIPISFSLPWHPITSGLVLEEGHTVDALASLLLFSTVLCVVIDKSEN